eukprot:662252-Rhodomonas_salina.1
MHDTPHTLADIGITAAAAQRARSALAVIWEHADAQPFCAPITTTLKPSGDVQPGSTPQLRPSVDSMQAPGSFTDNQLNCVWAAFCDRNPRTDWNALADIDCLEPDPKHCNTAMHNSRLKPFWLGAEKT